MSEMDCGQLRDCSAELALGVLSGTDRARALMHLEHCRDCQSEVDALASAGDALFDLVPAVEPPVGFESRVAARFDSLRPLGEGGRSSARLFRALAWARRRWVPVAAAVLALAAGGTGWAIGSATKSPALMAAGKAGFSWGYFHSSVQPGDIGEVFVSWGRPVWVFMTVDLGSGSGVANCFLVGKGGQVVQVGSLSLSRGFGYWGAAVQVPLLGVSGARIVASDGRVLATASFS